MRTENDHLRDQLSAVVRFILSSAMRCLEPSKQRLEAQRKYLHGAVVDAELRAATTERIDGLPDSAFEGERVRSFVAVSSWFWYCYPCPKPEDNSADSRAEVKEGRFGP